jgi:DNA/RNA-binding domain of Phe-tRNA-synthetase-like protein
MLDQVTVADEVHRLRPDYAVLVVIACGLPSGPSDDGSRSLLESSCRAAAEAGTRSHPHLAAWRDAYRAFGAKPQRTPPSVDALLARVETGIPAVNRVVDVYNAVSVRHVVPVGGEDLDRYRGPARLVRAGGGERFATISNGLEVDSPPDPGEVVWRDDDHVTCRRWNWRQCVQTRLGEGARRGLFIIDRLAPLELSALSAAGDELVSHLRRLAPDVRISIRLIPPRA